MDFPSLILYEPKPAIITTTNTLMEEQKPILSPRKAQETHAYDKLLAFALYVDETYNQDWEEGNETITTVDLAKWWIANV